MANIWGSSKLKKEEKKTDTKEVKKLIEDKIAETLNLSSVDPGEIVVFQDQQGKLKSSNVSLNDILVKSRTAVDNTIALYSSEGKLKPGVLVSTITDALKNLDEELEKHMTTYTALRRNIINKFFGTPAVTSPSLAEIKSNFDEINMINRFFGTPAVTSPSLAEIKSNFDEIKADVRNINNVGLNIIRDNISNIKKSIEDITKFKTDNLPLLEKIKIPHEKNIKNITYTILSGSLDWTPKINIVDVSISIRGVYRLTIVSPNQFNISSSSSKGINNVISTIIDAGTYERFTITSTDANLDKTSFTCYLEFVAKLN